MVSRPAQRNLFHFVYSFIMHKFSFFENVVCQKCLENDGGQPKIKEKIYDEYNGQTIA